jgi:hypothetical protein
MRRTQPRSDPRPASRRLRALIDRQAWNETQVVDLLTDFLDTHAATAHAFMAFAAARAAREDRAQADRGY